MSRGIGNEAEQQACDYLQRQGLSLVASNYSCRFGEIDLIMRDNDYLVFVEVKARKSNTFGGALESVTLNKQRKLIKSAEYYQCLNPGQNQSPMRFDVVILQGLPRKIEWLKNAFGMDF